jgi:hypothetical protein
MTFSGQTPYPPGVRIDDSPQATAVAADAVADQQGGEQRPDPDDSDQDNDVGTEENDRDETCKRVNCFPDRPSSAYIITNECFISQPSAHGGSRALG